jgi:hypothetical protein
MDLVAPEISCTFWPMPEGGGYERRLWMAVLVRALQDWQLSTPYRKNAHRFLFEEDENFSRVCVNAGLDPIRLRSALLTRLSGTFRPDFGSIEAPPDQLPAARGKSWKDEHGCTQIHCDWKRAR